MEEVVLENSILGREPSAHNIPGVRTAKTNYVEAGDYQLPVRIIGNISTYKYLEDMNSPSQTILANKGLADVLVRASRELKRESELFSQSVNVSRVRQVVFRATQELYFQHPKKLTTEVTYDDSVYITSIFDDFNIYLEIIFENNEEAYLFSIYQNKQCLISYEGNQEDTFIRIRTEISKIRNPESTQPRKSVFNSLTYIVNAISRPFNTIQ